MHPKLSIHFVTALLILFGHLCACKRDPAPANLVIITIDTLRADYLGAYGDPEAKTPTIDALAHGGLLFKNAMTPYTRTTPALASLMTGLWPHNHGSREVGQRFKSGKTLAMHLKEAGYQTLAVVSNPAAGRNQGLHRGFDRFLDPPRLPDIQAETITDQSLTLLTELPKESPFFLWTHYSDPHMPYGAPDMWSPQPEAPACRALIEKLDKNLFARGVVYSNGGGAAQDALADCKPLYRSSIAYGDHHLGRLLKDMKARGLLENTVVVLTSDHGENLGEDGLFYEHGPSLHDASLRVPLIIVGRGVEGGRVDEGIIRLEDIMPTLLTSLNIAPPKDWNPDGEDLSARLKPLKGGSPPPPVMAFSEGGSALHAAMRNYIISGTKAGRHCVNQRPYSLCKSRDEPWSLYNHQEDPGLTQPLEPQPQEIVDQLSAINAIWPPESARTRSLRTPTHKLIAKPKPQGGYEFALYDLEKDPEEAVNIATSSPKLFADLEAKLTAWKGLDSTSQEQTRSQDEEEALRALGYLE